MIVTRVHPKSYMCDNKEVLATDLHSADENYDRKGWTSMPDNHPGTPPAMQCRAYLASSGFQLFQ